MMRWIIALLLVTLLAHAHTTDLDGTTLGKSAHLAMRHGSSAISSRSAAATASSASFQRNAAPRRNCETPSFAEPCDDIVQASQPAAKELLGRRQAGLGALTGGFATAVAQRSAQAAVPAGMDESPMEKKAPGERIDAGFKDGPLGMQWRDLAPPKPDAKKLTKGDKVKINYILNDAKTGANYDKQSGFEYEIGDSEKPPGWNMALGGWNQGEAVGIPAMYIGQARQVVIPPPFGYKNGDEKLKIPRNTWVDLIVLVEKEVER